MKGHGLISYGLDKKQTCEVRIHAKKVKKHFLVVKRSSSLLKLVHSEISELNGMLNRGGNSYFITIIDDFSIFTYAYQ